MKQIMLGLIKERKPFYILMVDKQLEVSAAIGFYSLVIFCGFVVRIMYSPFELIDVNLLGNILYSLCIWKGNLRDHSLGVFSFKKFPSKTSHRIFGHMHGVLNEIYL